MKQNKEQQKSPKTTKSPPLKKENSSKNSNNPPNFPNLFSNFSPFVSLTALSAIILLIVPGELFYKELPPSGAVTILNVLRDKGEFSCGGGPFSYYAAIHLCCEKHDICYDQLQLNQTFCDDIFCSCLNSINSSIYCENVAQPGFGHLFHWSANCTTTEGGQMPVECLMLNSERDDNHKNK
uniref:Phospholipase A(2) n=1 Tax=Meloidogyne floridensis TaxID=298350 RepID=A0A915NRI3_9BILA